MLDYEAILAMQREWHEREEARRALWREQESALALTAITAQMNSEILASHIGACMALAMNPNVSDAFFQSYVASPPALFDMPA